MKIQFIKRGAATRLILIFAGWSTDRRYYEDCVVDGWDTAVVSDYRDLSMPSLPEQYATVYVFAYSLGVAAAALCPVKAAARIAICGSYMPASDAYGIPEAIYQATHDSLNERQLMKFHLRMAGSKAVYDSISTRLTKDPDIEGLKDELASIRRAASDAAEMPYTVFDRIYLAKADRIFPYSNLKAFWEKYGEAQIVVLDAPHAVDIASIVNDCLPDSAAIGEGFARAGHTYNESAVIQKEICEKIRDRLAKAVSEHGYKNPTLLEIGVGQGLLTQEWRNILTPSAATYIDLTDMPTFGIAPRERYLQADAEAWLEDSDEKFDVILSASTIQWFTDPIRFVASLRSHLNEGGIAIVSTFVKGNLSQLDRVRPCPIIYRTEKEYMSATESESELLQRTLTFDSVKEMLMHLRLTGVTPNRVPLGAGHKETKKDESSMRLTVLPNELTYRSMILVVKA